MLLMCLLLLNEVDICNGVPKAGAREAGVLRCDCACLWYLSAFFVGSDPRVYSRCLKVSHNWVAARTKAYP